MKKLSILLFCTLLLCSACRRTDDRVVAQVYHYKLYNSELKAMMPNGLSRDDSLTIVNDYIESWIKEKLILHEAEENLSPQDKRFEKEMAEYRNILLVNKYFDKLWLKDTTSKQVSNKEISDFAHSLDSRYTIEKEIVRVNYIKMPTESPNLERVKSLLFNENRDENKKELVELLGDTIEYLLDNDEWIYLDDLQNEVNFQIDIDKNGKKITNIDKIVGENDILLVILDYRSQRSVNETTEERAAAEMLLLNQRKSQFLDKFVNELYEKAVKEGKIVH